MFLSANKLTIASIGLTDDQVDFFRKFLKDFGKNLHSKWVHEGNHDFQETIETMGSGITAEYLVVDIDEEIGKRVWYNLSALRDDHKMIAFTRQPWETDALWVMQKPLFDFSVKKGLFDFSKADKPEEADKLVEMFNQIKPGK